MVKLSQTRLKSVIKVSKESKDNLDIYDDEEIMAHKACLVEYTSSDPISRHLKRKSNGKQQQLFPTKRTEDQMHHLILKRTVFLSKFL